MSTVVTAPPAPRSSPRVALLELAALGLLAVLAARPPPLDTLAR